MCLLWRHTLDSWPPSRTESKCSAQHAVHVSVGTDWNPNMRKGVMLWNWRVRYNETALWQLVLFKVPPSVAPTAAPSTPAKNKHPAALHPLVIPLLHDVVSPSLDYVRSFGSIWLRCSLLKQTTTGAPQLPPAPCPHQQKVHAPSVYSYESPLSLSPHTLSSHRSKKSLDTRWALLHKLGMKS